MALEFINCFELDIKKDIPAELTFYKNRCETLANHNHWYKKALIGTATTICLYIIYKTITHYAKKKESNQE